jgi:aldehyde:ferredoxin oxidoreductase
MDATETGTTLGLLMELWQRGIITTDDSLGAELHWGDVEAIEDTVEKIARGRDLGSFLAEGTVATARKIGRGAESYVCHAKGMTEVEDVRGFPGWALAYAISTRGCDHLKAHGQMDKQSRQDVAERLFGSPHAGIPTTPEGKGRSAKYHEDFEAVTNSLGGCMFNVLSLSLKRNPRLAMGLEDYGSLFSAATGLEMDREEILRCGARIVCLEKAFNARLGLDRKDDTLHGRWMDEPCPSGIGKGMKAADYLGKCLDDYYEARGFDIETGLPKRGKLAELGLESVADRLENLGALR